MLCSAVHSLVSRDDALPPGAAEAIESHIAACPDCQEEVFEGDDDLPEWIRAECSRQRVRPEPLTDTVH